MIQGQAKFDGIAVFEGTFSFLNPTVHLEGKAAFVDSKTGDTHGWTKSTQWSPEVIAKLAELRALMEVDLGRLHMHEGGETLTTRAMGVRLSNPETGGGLSEHVGDPVPSV